MLTVLKWLGYNVSEAREKKNTIPNNINYFLSAIYMIMSVGSALSPSYSLNLIKIGQDNKVYFDSNSVNTLVVIVINVVVLAKIYINLYIESKKAEDAMLEQLDDTQKSLGTIRAKTLDFRMGIIKAASIIISVIIGLNVCFNKNGIEETIKIPIIIILLITFFNDWVDIAKNKYGIEEKCSFEVNNIKEVTINVKQVTDNT